MPRSAWLLLPVITVAGIVAFVLIGRPLDDFAASAPPTEEIVVEQVRLEPGVIRLTVRVDGSDPVRIAQVQVDGAYRQFEQNPAGPLSRLASAVISIPYHWIEGETHHLLLLTSSGAAFEHTIEVAQATPTGSSFGLLLLVGILLGIAPVAAGLLAYPAIRDMRPAGLRFLLALTLGLLGFLFIDTIGEGLEIGGEVLGRLNGDVLVWVAAGVTLMTLLLAGRRSGKPPEGIRLAFFIALGIGLHNLGEGLVVGASLATGAVALATFLMVGFVLHNVTEGIGIATPMTKARPGWQVVRGACRACRPSGGRRRLGWLAGGQPAICSAQFRDRRRCNSPGHCRARRVYGAAKRCGRANQPFGGRGHRRRPADHVFDRHLGLRPTIRRARAGRIECRKWTG